jgi:hypothetical protein
MVVKRRKVGNTTITINTKTGRQTTSRRSGNITYSQSNQGHNRSTVTTNYGNGWFDRKTTNHNKKSRRKKLDWSWLFESSKSSSKKTVSVEAKGAKEKQPEFIGPPFPIFWKRKKFAQFTFFEWLGWLIALPFRVIWFIVKWTIILTILFVLVKFIVHLILYVV